MSEQTKCFACGDKGVLGGCPICGKEIQIIQIVPDFNKDDALLNLIPEAYRDPWNPQILIDKFPDYVNDKGFKEYVEKLNILVETYAAGKLPKSSAIIMSPTGLGKTRVAFTCMALAKEHGFSVSPLIDNTEYRRLNMLSTDNYLYKEFLRNNKHLPRIEDVIQSDVCFMTIDPCNFKESYQDIMSLLSKRDRLGKSTIILSQFTINQITYSDFTGSFLRLVTNRKISEKKSLKRLELFLEGRYGY